MGLDPTFDYAKTHGLIQRYFRLVQGGCGDESLKAAMELSEFLNEQVKLALKEKEADVSDSV